MARPFPVSFLAVTVAFCVIGGNARAGEYYTCKLANGRLEMRDTPCPADARTITARDVPEMTVPGAPPGEASMPSDGPGRVNVIPAPRPAAEPGPPGFPSFPASPGRDLLSGPPRAAKPIPSPVMATPFVDPEWDEGFIGVMVMRARFAGVLSSLHNLRTAAMMHQAENGTWPTRAEDMGLDSGTMQTKEIADVRFLPDGTILAKLKPGFGKDKFVAMQPAEELGGAQLGWKCRANFPKEFFGGAFGAGCESRTIASP